MFLGGTIVLAGVTVLFLGQPTTEMCLARPWFQHVALTFTLSCLLVKVHVTITILVLVTVLPVLPLLLSQTLKLLQTHFMLHTAVTALLSYHC
jgi:hypothetical protein